MDQLIHEHSILLGNNLPIDPTPETLSYYITFQSSHINLRSIESYLSGICNNLKLFFPEVQSNCAATLIKHTLKGALHCHGHPTKCKVSLTTNLLQSISITLHNSCDHNNMLFP